MNEVVAAAVLCNAYSRETSRLKVAVDVKRKGNDAREELRLYRVKVSMNIDLDVRSLIEDGHLGSLVKTVVEIQSSDADKNFHLVISHMTSSTGEMCQEAFYLEQTTEGRVTTRTKEVPVAEGTGSDMKTTLQFRVILTDQHVIFQSSKVIAYLKKIKMFHPEMNITYLMKTGYGDYQSDFKADCTSVKDGSSIVTDSRFYMGKTCAEGVSELHHISPPSQQPDLSFSAYAIIIQHPSPTTEPCLRFKVNVLGPGRVPVPTAIWEPALLLSALDWTRHGLCSPAPSPATPAPGEMICDFDFMVIPMEKGIANSTSVINIVYQPKLQPPEAKGCLAFHQDLQRGGGAACRIAECLGGCFNSVLGFLLPQLLQQTCLGARQHGAGKLANTDDTLINVARTLSGFYHHSSNTEFRRKFLFNLQVSEESGCDEMTQRLSSQLSAAVNYGGKKSEGTVENSEEEGEDSHLHLDDWSDEEVLADYFQD